MRQKNNAVDEEALSVVLRSLRKIINNHVGVIELADDLDIETVTEIFIRVNSAGATLRRPTSPCRRSPSTKTYGGNALRKAIDYFCHLSVAPEFLVQHREDRQCLRRF